MFEPPDPSLLLPLTKQTPNISNLPQRQYQQQRFAPLGNTPRQFQQANTSPLLHPNQNGQRSRNFQNFQKSNVYNRLGNRTNASTSPTNSNGDFVQPGPSKQNRWNRKRPYDRPPGSAHNDKRRWNDNRQFQPNNNGNHNFSVQKRLHHQNPPSKPPLHNQPKQNVEAEDITIEVANPNAFVSQSPTTDLVRFKMTLDVDTQRSIRILQEKCKQKQVIFPFPVTPNVTQLSLHERFSLL